jgi:hypothetical protein
MYRSSPVEIFKHLAVAELYLPKWSDRIHEKWIEAVLRARTDLDRQRLERTRNLMNAHIDDAGVEGYEARCRFFANLERVACYLVGREQSTD